MQVRNTAVLCFWESRLRSIETWSECKLIKIINCWKNLNFFFTVNTPSSVSFHSPLEREFTFYKKQTWEKKYPLLKRNKQEIVVCVCVQEIYREKWGERQKQTERQREMGIYIWRCFTFRAIIGMQCSHVYIIFLNGWMPE